MDPNPFQNYTDPQRCLLLFVNKYCEVGAAQSREFSAGVDFPNLNVLSPKLTHERLTVYLRPLKKTFSNKF